MKLTSSEYKEIARSSLRGKWVSAIFAGLVASLLGVFCTSPLFLCQDVGVMAGLLWSLETVPHYFLLLVAMGSIIAIIYFFIGGVIRFGYIDYNLALLDRRKAGVGTLFGKVSMMWRAICMELLLFFVRFCYTILLIVPGIVVSYTYAMVPYILEERPGYNVRKAMRISKKMMRGHRWELFRLDLSFLGWDILCFLTLGLACIYVIPYKSATKAVFYNEISGRASTYYGREEDDEES